MKKLKPINLTGTYEALAKEKDPILRTISILGIYQTYYFYGRERKEIIEALLKYNIDEHLQKKYIDLYLENEPLYGHTKEYIQSIFSDIMEHKREKSINKILQP